jgi:hypothetical protein
LQLNGNLPWIGRTTAGPVPVAAVLDSMIASGRVVRESLHGIRGHFDPVLCPKMTTLMRKEPLGSCGGFENGEERLPSQLTRTVALGASQSAEAKILAKSYLQCFEPQVSEDTRFSTALAALSLLEDLTGLLLLEAVAFMLDFLAGMTGVF